MDWLISIKKGQQLRHIFTHHMIAERCLHSLPGRPSFLYFAGFDTTRRF